MSAGAFSRFGNRAPQDDVVEVAEEHSDDDYSTEHSSHSQISQSLTPSLIIIHMVECAQTEHHMNHSVVSYYTDVPRLFAGDSKAVALRGQNKIADPQILLDESRDVSFVIYRRYDCVKYHQQCEPLFETLATEKQRSKMPLDIQAHLSVLGVDGPAASSASEAIRNFQGRMLAAVRALDHVYNWDLASYYRSAEDWSLQAPYNDIYRSREALQNYKGMTDSMTWPFVDYLISYIMSTMAVDYEEADELFTKNQVSEKHLAKLFRAGDIMVTREEGEEIAVTCHSVHGQESGMISLACRLWEFDASFHLRPETFRLIWPRRTDAAIGDPMPITNLSTYPLKYGGQDLRERLLERGRMLWSCRFQKYVSYDAPKQGIDAQAIHSRYMIDMNAYHELHPESNTRRENWRMGDIDEATMESDNPPPEKFLLCLPATLRGYWFLKKRWVTLKIRYIKEVTWEESAFETLVLDNHKKEMLKALVTTHDSGNTSLDVIEGKGNGLILLLHGPPGTGKTLTAEGIAELTHKPLYRVTCGDIGTTPDVVERYLDSVLHIGRVWGCVVLLDEADVFLEERSPMNLERNALVSILLRVLEYYEGILILTTNRVGTFDEAFKSRVQLAIHYPSLNQEDRMSIWSNFLESMGDEVDIHGLRKKYMVLSLTPLNGRQIRNTIKTARQLALFKKEVMGYSHLQETIKISNEFEDYIQQAMGQTHAQRAVDTSMRAPEPTE
ncbi:P-loop containing nucleoside triphosphate hydrolase protein [Aureobasidium pullulans]|nr:P-loop containing nucleoside triphosphate hydrolase protein [Aureobasidium pullulans]